MTEDAGIQRYMRLDWQAWRRLVRAVVAFGRSDVGGKAKVLFAALLVLLFAIAGLNVVSSYVGRDFMTAIEHRDTARFIREGIVWVAVFGVTTVTAVVFRFAEERLGLLWREWMTRRLLRRYLSGRVYYRLNVNGALANPDQRIADDVRVFATTTLSFVLMVLNGTFTIAAFSGVLWSISPQLFFVAVSYAAGGSALAIALGRPLIWLNYHQSDREADFRTDLIHVRENADSVALLHREGRIEARLLRHLEALTGNLRRIIAINRNLGFFTTGYNYLIQIIPVLIVAPLFIRGRVEFGVITQSVMAFSHLLGAFSLVVTQFQSISSYAAVSARLSALRAAMREAAAPERPTIEIVEDADRLSWERLTLCSPRDGRTLVDDLSASVPRGTRLLIRGPVDTAKVALFRATAGIWDCGSGRIVRPGLEGLLFLPERPYLPPGTLREVLVRSGQEQLVSGERILAALYELGLEKVVARAGGLDSEREWHDILSMDEQQLLAFTRLLIASPKFVFLDRIGTALNARQVEMILKACAEQGITYVTIGNGQTRLTYYDAIVDLASDGSWRWLPVRAGRIVEGAARDVLGS